MNLAAVVVALKKVAEKLVITCYDAELIHELSKENGFVEEYIKEAGKNTPGNYLSNFFANRASTKVVTCEEDMNSKNWTWSESKKACVYRVTNTSAK